MGLTRPVKNAGHCSHTVAGFRPDGTRKWSGIGVDCGQEGLVMVVQMSQRWRAPFSICAASRRRPQSTIRGAKD